MPPFDSGDGSLEAAEAGHADASEAAEAGHADASEAAEAGHADASFDDAAQPDGGDVADTGLDAAVEGGAEAGADGGSVSDGATDGAPSGDSGTDAGVAPAVPAGSGSCPAFVSGDVSFSPAGVAARKVRLWAGEGGGGPLVIYWHSTGAQPSEAETRGLSGVLGQITAAGGVVAAPYTGANDGTFPWLSTTAESLKVADEIVACAIEKKSIDARRIHVLGFSAGGLMTSTMSLQRSAYVASVAPYSGGLQGSATFQDASNKFAALVFHGGSSDSFLINFQSTSTSYKTALRSNGNYVVLCNHAGGHAIPSAGPAAAWRFFQDHPYRTDPSPYVAEGLPASLPSYCQAQP